MALFVISDLHLSTSVNKPMDVFGFRWRGYQEKIETNWRSLITSKDTVVIPGDISWGMKPEEAIADLAFIHSLPGKKILGKGNHDLWWQSMKKLGEYTSANGFDSISFLFNNCYETEGYMICGSRGWWADPSADAIPEGVDFEKIIAREVGRMRASLSAARLKMEVSHVQKPILMFLHFPVTFMDKRCHAFRDVLLEFGVRDCYFGHIHNVYDVPSSFEEDGIRYHLVSADYLNFVPRLIDRDDRWI